MMPVIVLALATSALAACSGDDREGGDGAADTTTTAIERPAGPVAELSLLTAGTGVNLVATRPVDLEAAGYEEEEYAASGTATSYRSVGELPADGAYDLEPDQTADYRTRLVVRRPADPADFNGTVVVEWLNVSGGIDSSPDWTYGAAELLRRGFAWVGVSAQQVGVQGGSARIDVEGVPEGGLKAADPERYGDLVHPGDAFAFDIYTQVARALRDPGAAEVLGELEPERLVATGQSQSAFALTTYVNGVQPLTEAFDGFLVHSRNSSGLPLGEPGRSTDLAGSLGGTAVQIREDGRAPVLVVEMEGDLLGVIGYYAARQPDSERVRTWEVAGAAHADAWFLGANVERFDCGGPINDGPQRFVVRSALRHLDEWVRGGDVPPTADPVAIDESGGSPAFVRDADGNVEGGIRTPPLDVPVAVLSGDPVGGSQVLCLLFGKTEAFSPERLAELYLSADEYLDAYEAAADEAIAGGWVLEEDREELLADAQPDVVDG